MTVRIISSVVSAGIIIIYLLNILYPAAPLFYFASNNEAINILRLFLAAIVLTISFKGSFTYQLTHMSCVLVGATLFGLGLAGSLTVLQNSPSLIALTMGPLDYSIALELGIVMIICALENSQMALPVFSRPIRLVEPLGAKLARVRLPDTAYPVSEQGSSR